MMTMMMIMMMMMTSTTQNIDNDGDDDGDDDDDDDDDRFKRRTSRFLQSPLCFAGCLQNVRSSGQGAIMCNTSSAYHAQYAVCHVTRRDSSAQLEKSRNRIYFSFIFLAETTDRSRRGGNRSTWRKPMTTSFKECHMLKPENSSPNRDSNPHSRIGGRLGKQTC